MFAYLDAGTGSVIIQVIAGGVAGVFGYLKYRAGWFRHRKGTPSDEATAESS